MERIGFQPLAVDLGKKYPPLQRVEQHNWAEPRLNDWIDAISVRVARANTPMVLVAHSLACIAVAYWVQKR